MELNKATLLEEQLRKGEKIDMGLPWRFLAFMIISFILLVFLYVGMEFGYKPYLDRQIKNYDMEIKKITTALETTNEQNLAQIYSQFVNIQTLLKNHLQPSKLFTFWENTIHPKVYYTSFTLSIPERGLSISGVAQDFKSVIEQMEIYRLRPEVKNVEIGKIGLDENKDGKGGTTFVLNLILKDEIFR
jgi:Tfp pilus assembly protein PilN